jgi:hypothetical protein
MDSPTLVSWQSAFWGLVPIAINSMSQPTGKVCDAPRAISPWMRVSPIICFLDMLSIICRLVYYSISKRSVQAASTIIMTQRYAYDHDDAESALADFRYDAPLRWASFLLSIAQIAKLFAAQGLIWTKLWASMYLASFLVVELFVSLSRLWLPATWPPTRWPAGPEDVPNPMGARSLPYISIAASTIFALFFAIQAVASVFEHYGRHFNALDCTGMVLLICGGPAFIPSSLYSYTVRRDPAGVPRAGILLFAVVAVPSVYLFAFLQHDNSPLTIKTTNILVPVMIVVWAIICLAWASSTFARADTGAPGSLRNLERALSRYFFCFNVVVAVMYYAFSYDPQGTYKPAWTEKLG